MNGKGLDAAGRLETMPAGGMCNHKVKVTEAARVDIELIDWIKAAYDSAG